MNIIAAEEEVLMVDNLLSAKTGRAGGVCGRSFLLGRCSIRIRME